jgi:hypothetical protein
MFEKVGRLAERVASNTGESRRGFLGQIGQGALAAAAVIGGLLLRPEDARAGGLQGCINKCCEATCGKGDKTCSCDPTGNAYGSCYANCVARGF